MEQPDLRVEVDGIRGDEQIIEDIDGVICTTETHAFEDLRRSILERHDSHLLVSIRADAQIRDLLPIRPPDRPASSVGQTPFARSISRYDKNATVPGTDRTERNQPAVWGPSRNSGLRLRE